MLYKEIHRGVQHLEVTSNVFKYVYKYLFKWHYFHWRHQGDIKETVEQGISLSPETI